MTNPFVQRKIFYKVLFKTSYKNIALFEQFFPEDILGLSAYEIESSTIDSQPNDVWQVEVYVLDEIKQSLLKEQIYLLLKKENIALIGDVDFETVEEKDWVSEYEKQQKPVEIGRFLFGSKTNLNNSILDKTQIYLGASGAFGTGDHETTAGCILAMEHFSTNPIENIFDIGTGSGILSFAAEKIWPNAIIIACDIEEASIKVAEINKNLNNSKVTFYQNKEDNLLIPVNQPKYFDLIISNILAVPLINLSTKIKSISNEKTKVVLSGFLEYQKNEVLKAYENAGFVAEKIRVENDWVTLTLKPKVS